MARDRPREQSQRPRDPSPGRVLDDILNENLRCNDCGFPAWKWTMVIFAWFVFSISGFYGLGVYFYLLGNSCFAGSFQGYLIAQNVGFMCTLANAFLTLFVKEIRMQKETQYGIFTVTLLYNLGAWIWGLAVTYGKQHALRSACFVSSTKKLYLSGLWFYGLWIVVGVLSFAFYMLSIRDYELLPSTDEETEAKTSVKSKFPVEPKKKFSEVVAQKSIIDVRPSTV